MQKRNINLSVSFKNDRHLQRIFYPKSTFWISYFITNMKTTLDYDLIISSALRCCHAVPDSAHLSRRSSCPGGPLWQRQNYGVRTCRQELPFRKQLQCCGGSAGRIHLVWGQEKYILSKAWGSICFIHTLFRIFCIINLFSRRNELQFI